MTIEFRSGLYLFCSPRERKALGLCVGVEHKHFRWRWRARLCCLLNNMSQPPRLLGEYRATYRTRLILVHDSKRMAA